MEEGADAGGRALEEGGDGGGVSARGRGGCWGRGERRGCAEGGIWGGERAAVLSV